MVQGIFLQMTNSVNKQNASDISLFISVLKHYIHNMGSQQCDKYRGKFVCNNSCQTWGTCSYFFMLIISKVFGYEDHFTPI